MKKLLLSTAAVVMGLMASATTVTFDFATNDYGLDRKSGTAQDGYIDPGYEITSGDVTITLNGVAGSNNWRLWTDGLRAYASGSPSFTVSTSNNENVTSVSINGISGCNFALQGETKAITKWTGNQASVTFDYIGTKNLSLVTLTVTYGEGSADGPGTEDPGTGDPTTPPSTDITNVLGNLSNGQNVSAVGVITALDTRGFVVTDNGGSVLYYNDKVNIADYAIGTIVNIAGEVSLYNRGYQLTNTATVVKAGTKPYTYPTPTAYSAAMIDAACDATTNINATYVSLEGKISISGNYYNVIIDGASAQGSIYYATDEIKAKLTDGNTYQLYGYFTSVSSSSSNNMKYFNIVLTDATQTGSGSGSGGDNEPSTPPSTDLTNVLGNLSEGATVSAVAVVTAQSSRGLILTDNGGSVLYYNTGVDLATYPIGTIVNISGVVSLYNRGYEFTNAAVITVAGSQSYTYPSPKTYTAAMMDEVGNSSDIVTTEYVSIEGALSISVNNNNTYYNVTVPGTTVQGSIYYPTEAIVAQLEDGKSYNLTGYLTAISGSSTKYFNIVVVNATEVTGGSGGGDTGNTPEYTVEQALDQIAMGVQEYATVTGYIIDITEVSLTYGYATFTIADDMSFDEGLIVFRTKYLNEEKFTASDQIAVGGQVKVYGYLTMFDADSEIVSCKLLDYEAPEGGGDNTPGTGDQGGVNKVIFSESFSASLGGFSVQDISLPDALNYVWSWGGENFGAKASAFYNKTNNPAESWLISPEIDLTGYTDVYFSFQNAVNYLSGNDVNDFLEVLVAPAGTAAGNAAWQSLNQQVTFGNGSNWDFTEPDENEIDIPESLYGQKIQIAFAYTSTEAVACTWEIKNFVVTGTTVGAGVESIAIDFNAPVEYYNLQGVRVANPAKGQIYILRQGNTSRKAILR